MDLKSSGSKYLRNIFSAMAPGEQVTVDVYAVLVAFNVTDPGLQHAIKKLLCCGIRGKATKLQDMKEAIDAINRSVSIEENNQSQPQPADVRMSDIIELQKRAAADLRTLENINKAGTVEVVYPKVFQATPHWEVVRCYNEDPLDPCIIGYRVRWSAPDIEGRFLWVGHYLTENGEPSPRWCESAAISDCKNKTEQGKHPSEYPSYRPSYTEEKPPHQVIGPHQPR